MTTLLSFASCNLFNLNEPGIRIYRDSDGWSEETYQRKIDWTAAIIKRTQAEVWAFQELWHQDSLHTLFQRAELQNYTLLVPANHRGGKIVCAAAVRSDLYIENSAEWIEQFPNYFTLASSGEDPQTGEMSISVQRFSRPVLHFRINAHEKCPAIHCYVCHFKSKAPTRVDQEPWYDSQLHKKHRAALGATLSTIRRTVEASALRIILTERMKKTNTPVVVMGDLNDSQQSNTLNILTAQPSYLLPHQRRGGSDTALYSTGTLQEYRSQRDVYYTHVYKNHRESLDHILVSQEFYDNSRKRIWAFTGMELTNDHLNNERYEEQGATDHGIIKASFKYKPAR